MNNRPRSAGFKLVELPTVNRRKREAFTLVELLVVIGIIALLVSILLPSLNKARQQAFSLKCQSNLRQVAMAALMYADAYKGALPYPTTTHGEYMLWWNAVDPFMGSKYARQNAGGGVATGRTYKAFKQCPIWETFEEDKDGGAQGVYKEYARTIKMNNLLRRNGLPGRIFQTIEPSGSVKTIGTVKSPDRFDNARVTDCRPSAQFVIFGDGLSLDSTGQIASQNESGQFSMECDKIDEGSPAIRHIGGANIAFVDGHVELVKLPTITKGLMDQPNIKVLDWESEFVDNSGTPVNPKANVPFESQGLHRNPKNRMVWGIPGKLFGRNDP